MGALAGHGEGRGALVFPQCPHARPPVLPPPQIAAPSDDNFSDDEVSMFNSDL